MDYSPDQARALDAIRDWYRKAPKVRYCTDPDCSPGGGAMSEEGLREGVPHTHGGAQDYPVLSLAGLAGSGKSALSACLGAELGAAIAFATPTNKAAGVLRRKLDPAAARKVRTYFSMMYYPVFKHRCLVSGRSVSEMDCGCALKRGGEDKCDCPRRFRPCGACGKCKVDTDTQFVLRESVGGHRDLVVIDEASMVSEVRVNEIRSLGVPVLLVGDHGQLPPVRERMNRWMLSPNVTLTTNHRQAEANGIVAAALRMRTLGDIGHGRYGDGSTMSVSAKANPDVLEIMNPDRLVPGSDSMIIVAANAMRASVNQRIHQAVVAGGRDPQSAAREAAGLAGLPGKGDRVISLQNHYGGVPMVTLNQFGWTPVGQEFVWNGMTGTVREVNPRGEDQRNTAMLIVELDDVPARVAGGGNAHVLVKADARQFGAPAKMRPDEHARDAQLWDYAYALTAHKCADETTQILTTEGWKTHDQVTPGDLALTLNPETQLSEWQPVQAVHRYTVENEPLLSIEAESHSSLTTLNHRWPVLGFRNQTVWRTSSHLLARPQGYHGIFKAARHHGFPEVPKYSDSFVELVAWFWTEGGIMNNRGKPIGAVKIHQSATANPENVVQIRAALLTEFGKARRLGRYMDKSPAWNESSRQVTQAARNGKYAYPERTFEYIRFGLNNAAGEQLQQCAPGKVIAPEFLLTLTCSQLELFISISLKGDGHITDDGHASIRQSSRERLEAFQFACVLAGYSTVIRHEGGTWKFRLKQGQMLNPRPQQWREAMSVVPYTGTVWCPQTENGTWYAKRNETTYFTGNSQGSEYSRVVVLDTNPSERKRWMYTAMTRAKDKLVVIDWR